MDAIGITLGVSWTAAGLLCLAAAAPLAMGRVARNAFYGVRFRKSFQSDEAWYAINRFGGRRLIAWSIPIIALGVTSFFLPLQSHKPLMVAVILAQLSFIGIPVIQTWRFARTFTAGHL